MEKRIAAYILIFIAGTASASLGFAWLDGPHGIIRGFLHPSWKDLQFVILAGAAALTAAALVHTPFMRAARDGHRPRLYGWTMAGVLASHVAYTTIIFLHNIFFLPEFSHANSLSLTNQIIFALMVGFISLWLGFILNTLFGICLAEAVLWLRKARPAASAQTDAQQIKIR